LLAACLQFNATTKNQLLWFNSPALTEWGKENWKSMERFLRILSRNIAGNNLFVWCLHRR